MHNEVCVSFDGWCVETRIILKVILKKRHTWKICGNFTFTYSQLRTGFCQQNTGLKEYMIVAYVNYNWGINQLIQNPISMTTSESCRCD